MNSFKLNHLLLYISLIIFSFLFSEINTQENNLSIENQKLNQFLLLFNSTNIKFQNITSKMSNIKYNILLIMRYKGLQITRNSLERQYAYIKKKLNENGDNQKILNDIDRLNEDAIEFDKKCDRTNNAFYESEKAKIYIIKVIKKFLLYFSIFIIILFLIIGIITYFVIKSQRYHALKEENSEDDELEGGKHSNSQTVIIKQRNEEDFSTSRKFKKKSKSNISKDKKKSKKSKKKSWFSFNLFK